MRSHSIRLLAPLAVLVVVVALMGVIFALRAGSGSTRAAAGVMATTPPDAVHVVVTHLTSYSTVPDPRSDCPANTTCITTAMTPSTSIVYDHTFTDAATVQRLQADLNAPSVASAKLPDTSVRCTYDVVTYDFTFTAGRQTVEKATMRAACDAFDLRTGFAPDLTLGADRAITPGVIDVLNTTYGRIPASSPGLSKLP